MSARGVCQICGTTRSLRRDGTIREHWETGTSHRCMGSGWPPAGDGAAEDVGASCPLWCSKAGGHPPDLPDGARVHQHRVSPAVAVVQVDHPGGREPAVIAVEDVDLSPDDVQQFALDLAGAAWLVKAGAR